MTNFKQGYTVIELLKFHGFPWLIWTLFKNENGHLFSRWAVCMYIVAPTVITVDLE